MRSPPSRSLILLWVVAGALVAPCSVEAAPTVGGVAGRVLDEESWRPVAEAVVSVSGPALQGEQVALSDASGRYVVTGLPPGEYVVRFERGAASVERPGVLIEADQTVTVDVRLPAAAHVYQTTARPPAIDATSHQLGVTASSALLERIPLRDPVYDVLTLAPGSYRDPVGVGVGGATGAENRFFLDGLDTTSPLYGLVGTQIAPEFLQSTELLTGGYAAERGRATGGLVSLVTKSGSNELHGSAWVNYAPFQLAPRRIARPGEAIATLAHGGSLDRYDHALDFGVDLGGALLKDRIWFYVGVAPSFIDQSYDRILRARTAATPEEAAAGGAGSTSACPAWVRAQNPALCAPSLTAAATTHDLDEQYNHHDASQSRAYRYIAKLGFRFDDDNRLTLTYVGSPSTFRGAYNNPRNPASPGVDYNGNPDTTRFEDDLQVHDVLAHFVSKFVRGRVQLDLLAGVHHEADRYAPLGSGADLGRIDDYRLSPLARFEPGVTPCAPTQVGGVDFDPCPVTAYRDGGFGQFGSTSATRFSLSAALTGMFHLAGSHVVRVGGDFEDVLYANRFGYTGSGAGSGRFRVLPDGSVQRKQFAVLNEASGQVELLEDGVTSRTSTQSQSLYLRDSWTPSFLPSLTVDAGLRWEAQELRDGDGHIQIGIYDNLAPRVGLAWDFLGGGRSKLYASYGRYYESIPLSVNDLVFSNQGLAYQGAAACPADAAGHIDVTRCDFGPLTRQQLVAASIAAVSPVLKGQYNNEVLAGVQLDVGWGVVLGAAYLHRDLGRIIEDLSPDATQHAIIANPGVATDAGAVAAMQRDLDALSRRIASASTTDQAVLVAQRDALSQKLALYRSAAGFAKPRRDYNALVVTAEKRFSDRFTLLASYTYSRTLGNYPGLYDAGNHQLQPNLSTQYDLPELLANRNGSLPTDRPHNFKLAAAYAIPLGRGGALTVGTRFTVLSGRPINVLGAHPLGPNEVYILPRGSGGRTPTLTQLDLLLAWSREFQHGLRAELSIDIYNLYNAQTPTDVDDTWTNDYVRPIPGGSYADLRYLKTIAGSAPQLNPNYGQPIAYQAPLSMRFGARFSF